MGLGKTLLSIRLARLNRVFLDTSYFVLGSIVGFILGETFSQYIGEGRENRRGGRRLTALTHAFVTPEHRLEFLNSTGQSPAMTTAISELANRAGSGSPS